MNTSSVLFCGSSDNHPFIITGIGTPNNGNAQIVDGIVIYTPNTDFIGIDVFTYTICDVFNNCDEGTVTVNVTNAGECNNDVTYCAEPFEPMQVCVNFCTVTDAVITNITGQQGNSIGSPNGNCFNYTVLGGNTSNDILTIEACNAANECETIEITIVVECVEPIANDDAVNVNPNGTATVNVLNNDIQLCGFTLNAQLLNDGLYGSVTLVNGVLTYTPNVNVVAVTDVLTYIACNNCDEQLCDTATIFVTVNPNPTAVVIANPDQAFTNQNTSVNIPVLNNDIGQNINVSDIDYNGIGSVVLNGNGTVTYTPSLNFFGTDEFTYTICNENIPPNCDSTTVQITVWPNGPNQQPIVQDDVVQTQINQTITIPVLDNDFDPDGGTLTVTNVSSNPNGITTINPDGTITFIPNEGFTGVVILTYTACDNGQPILCDTGTISIYVGFPIPNQPPIGNNDNAETNENTAVIIDVLENDFDLEGDILTVSIVTNPINGTATVNDDGTITYTPNAGFTGTDMFVYQVCDTSDECDVATVVITVNAVVGNQTPIANDDNVNVEANNLITINVLANDIDPDGNIADLDITITQEPTVGAVTLNPDGTITYVPPTDFVGVITFTYEICDEEAACDTATVTVVVTEPANNTINAEPDVAFTPENTAVDIDILANDQGLNITSILITGFPNNGNVQINPFTNIAIYVPNTGFVGEDFFFYEICNNAGCDQTIVGITVFAEGTPNQAPFANNDVDTTSINTPVTVNVLANDSDPENGNLTVQPILNVEPTNGTAVVNPDGTITYTPNNGFTGEDSFVYEVCDESFDGWPVICVTATVVITVGTGEFSNTPPIANDDTQVVQMNATIEIPVMINDLDPDGDVIVISTISTQPANGTASILPTGTIQYTPNNGFLGDDYLIYVICDNGNPVLCDTAYVEILVIDETVNECVVFDETLEETPITICVTDYNFELPFDVSEIDFSMVPTDGVVYFDDALANDCFVYVPNENFNGLEVFEVIACSNLPECKNITITIDVLPVNDAPIANFDTAETPINVSINIPILDNDTDPDGDVLIIEIIEMPTNGTAVVAANGTIFYVPNADFEGTDTLIYQVEDPSGLTDTAIVYITVGETDTSEQVPPIAVNDTVTIDVDENIEILVLANDTDPDGDDELINVVEITQDPQNGTAVITDDNTIFYSPNVSFVGFDTIVYWIEDEDGLMDSAIIFITVGNPDTSDMIPPIANPDFITMELNTDTLIPALGNDEDPDGDVTLLTIIDIMVQPENGTAEITEDAISILYTPNSNFIGEDIIVYVIEDEDGLTDFDTIFITVTADTVQQVTYVGTTNDADTLCINVAKEIFVLTNDTLIDIPATSFIDISVITDPENGSTLINSNDGFNDNSITYVPNIDFVGIDSFTYAVCVDDICDTAMVNVIVYPADNGYCLDDEIDDECDDIFIPNGFSPNGDGENDFWLIPNLQECFPENEVQIFNRWGDLVFSQKNYDSNNAWDGTWQQNDKDVPDGTYFYVLMYGEEKKASFIEVRR